MKKIFLATALVLLLVAGTITAFAAMAQQDKQEPAPVSIAPVVATQQNTEEPSQPMIQPELPQVEVPQAQLPSEVSGGDNIQPPSSDSSAYTCPHGNDCPYDGNCANRGDGTNANCPYGYNHTGNCNGNHQNGNNTSASGQAQHHGNGNGRGHGMGNGCMK